MESMAGREKLTTTLNGELIKQIKILAIKKGCSANDLIEEAIQEYLNKYAKEPQGETSETPGEQVPKALKNLMSAIEGQVMHYVRALPLKDESVKTDALKDELEESK
jgi:hypothetical protein